MRAVSVKTLEDTVKALRDGDVDLTVDTRLKRRVVRMRWGDTTAQFGERLIVGGNTRCLDMQGIVFAGSQFQVSNSNVELSNFHSESAYAEDSFLSWRSREKGGGSRSLCIFGAKNIKITNSRFGMSDDESMSVSNGCEDIVIDNCTVENGRCRIFSDMPLTIDDWVERFGQEITFTKNALAWSLTAKGADPYSNAWIQALELMTTDGGKGVLVTNSKNVTVKNCYFRNISGRCPDVGNDSASNPLGVQNFVFDNNVIMRHSWSRTGEIDNTTGSFTNNRYYNVDRRAVGMSYNQEWLRITNSKLNFSGNTIDDKPATMDDFAKRPV